MVWNIKIKLQIFSEIKCSSGQTLPLLVSALEAEQDMILTLFLHFLKESKIY